MTAYVTIDNNGYVTWIKGTDEASRKTAGQYDLTLFTCTYDGKNRFTVRCNRAD